MKGPRKVRSVITSIERGSAHQAQPEMSESGFEEPAPAPVFVDRTGLRGRLLRGFGWPVSVVGAILAVAMGSSLIGVQADAPAMGIPAQPSRSPASSPSPLPSLSSIPLSASSASSSARTATRSAAPRTKTSATPSKPTVTPSKPKTTASRGAKPSGPPAKHP
ncbi:hypothetical protein OG592_39405 [Streptomyces avidinii]|uniref:hypothetical protein n=1 Tax=Streptomyces avidinii TaxID=1895 RepID=UPI00386C8C05|nr:hypothetical protein OG592_39405 [Streptomyces avidinii]